jgi:hypothetical protein
LYLVVRVVSVIGEASAGRARKVAKRDRAKKRMSKNVRKKIYEVEWA